jgi:hypothetical protein
MPRRRHGFVVVALFFDEQKYFLQFCNTTMEIAAVVIVGFR